MIYLRNLVITATLLFASPIYAQVGINTVNPMNDLHINGGLRIEDAPPGTDEDANNRLLARTIEGDLVEVTAKSVLESFNVPILAFNALFGTSTTPFFADCAPCTSGATRRFNLSDQETIITSPLVTLEQNSAAPSDEFFRINEAGTYKFELSFAPVYRGNGNVYRVNIKLEIYDQAGVLKEEEVIRMFGGEVSIQNSNFGLSGYVTDTRNYDVNDAIIVRMEIPLAFRPAGASVGPEITSARSIGATYEGQISITKY